MLVVLSGEGKSDLGYKADNGDFIKGPMVHAIEYFFLKEGQHPQYHYISEKELTKIRKRKVSLFIHTKLSVQDTKIIKSKLNTYV